MKILVTGAGGYIGSVLVPMLLNKGHQVVALDRFFFGEDKLPPEGQGLLVKKDDIRFVGKTIFEGVDAVVDLAALSNDPSGELDPVKTYSINHLGRLRIAVVARSMGVKRYILPSSCSIYGFKDEVVNETSGINPLTVYAKANYLAEEDILNLADDSFCVVILRQATVYGFSPRMRFDLAINGMVKGFFTGGKIPILKDGTQWRPFIHVKDTSKAIISVLESNAKLVNKQLFNVGSNEQNYQIFDLARRVADAINIPFEYEWYGLPDLRSYRVDFSKIKNTVGFSPDYNAEKGAEEVWKALKEGKLNPDDPMSITVQWYKKILSEGAMV